MSSRARRVIGATGVQRYDWNGTLPPPGAPSMAAPAVSAFVAPAMTPAVNAAAIERDAFTKGYAQGERAGADAAAARGDAVLRRLAETIEELGALKADILHKTEQQVVQLALEIARRVIHREVSLDRELLAAMGRVALERLGGAATATIRLHPDDYAAVMAGQGDAAAGNGVTTVVADPLVRRGGCLVQSDFGLIDVSVDSQIRELATALLGETDTEQVVQTADVFVAR
jgi:flagellar assembly protein FliH